MKEVSAMVDRRQPKNNTDVESGWSRETMVVFLMFALHAAAFTWYTGQIWEDYFITFKFSQNLAEGRGLTYDGEHPIHGFTSPLGTLLPAFFHWMFRADSYEPALNAFRSLSILAYAAAGALLYDFLAKRHRGGRWTAWVFALLFLLDAKSVAFSTNGMETGIMLFFVALAFVRSQTTAADDWWGTGLVWAGLLWSRPDGVVYVAVFALLQLLRVSIPFGQRLLVLIRQSILAGLVYLPWLLFATIYFGSPIPQTVRAKSMFSYRVEQLLAQPAAMMGDLMSEVYSPIYWHLGDLGWSVLLRPLLFVASGFAAMIWLFPLRDPIARSASLGTFLVLLYAMWIPAFPWYFPPIALLASIAIASFVSLGPSANYRIPRRIGTILIPSILVLAFAYMDLGTFHQCRLQQHWIEWGNRKRVADWLRDHVPPEETVFLESLGYIGYFSGRRILDFPGLVTPSMVEVRREPEAKQFNAYGCSYAFLRLQPTWLVARPQEYGQIAGDLPEFVKQYVKVKEFDVYPDLAPLLPFPGATWVLFDSKFVVFRRMDGDASTEATLP